MCTLPPSNVMGWVRRVSGAWNRELAGKGSGSGNWNSSMTAPGQWCASTSVTAKPSKTTRSYIGRTRTTGAVSLNSASTNAAVMAEQ
jgi:hypothetical protein